MIALELMTTEGCHLCDDAVALLVATLDPERYTVDLVDIAFDDQLMDAYATRIPVLRTVDPSNELNWPFDQAALRDFLAAL